MRQRFFVFSHQKCQYCIARAGKSGPDELSDREIDRILDELIALKVQLINITGGEPLLRKETALHIAERASEHNIGLELLTNGMVITRAVARELYRAGMRNAQVSLDSARPEVHDIQRGVKGGWKKTVEGIKNLREAGIHIITSVKLARSLHENF